MLDVAYTHPRSREPVRIRQAVRVARDRPAVHRQDHRRVYYAPTAEVLGTLHAARADGTYCKVFRRVSTADLLILDDAGFSDLGRDAAILRFSGKPYRQPREVHGAPLDNA